MSASDAYRLSRVQAEGWNAARSLPPSDLADIDAATVHSLNPYRSDPEKARWVAGFYGAFKVLDAGSK